MMLRFFLLLAANVYIYILLTLYMFIIKRDNAINAQTSTNTYTTDHDVRR